MYRRISSIAHKSVEADGFFTVHVRLLKVLFIICLLGTHHASESEQDSSLPTPMVAEASVEPTGKVLFFIVNV